MVHGFKAAFFCVLKVRQNSFHLRIFVQESSDAEKGILENVDNHILSEKHRCFILLGKLKFSPKDCPLP